MSGRITLAAVSIALAGSGLLAGQAPQSPSPDTAPGPTFRRTRISTVEVDALVADQQGNFVANLQKEDFQIQEDGKPQTISAFSLIDIPVVAATSTASAVRVEPDVQSNLRPFDGRVYVVVLDDLHVDAARSPQVKQAARQFIERNLGADDLMAVTFTGRTSASQEFTSNKGLLLNAVDAFVGSQLQGSTLSKNDQYHQRIDLPVDGRSWFLDDLNDVERGNNAQSMLGTLRQVSAWLGGIHGRRKTLLLFSEGIPYDLSDLIRGPLERPSPAGSIASDLRDTLAMTARSNVSIYGIDPRGLTTTGDASVGSFAGQTDPSSGIGLVSLGRELTVSQDSLRQLSEESGGFAAVNRNDLTAVFDRIVRDNSSYYLLAYYPASAAPDGKFHRIELTVNRPGLTVRARRGYAAPRAAPTTTTNTATNTATKTPTKPAATTSGGMPEELSAAMTSLLPVTGLTMRVFAAPFKGSKRNASVMIGIEVSGDSLGPDSDGTLDLSFVAMDRNAKMFGARHDSLPLAARANSRTPVGQSGVRVLNRLELPPGRYRLRAAALDTRQKRVGSVVYHLAVPDFDKQSIALSGVTVTSLAGTTMMTAILDDQMKDALPAPFVALRTFSRSNQLDLFAEVYDNSGKSPHKVDVVTTVLTVDGRQVTENRDEHDSTEFKGAKRALRYTAHSAAGGISARGLRVEHRGPVAARQGAVGNTVCAVPGRAGRHCDIALIVVATRWRAVDVPKCVTVVAVQIVAEEPDARRALPNSRCVCCRRDRLAADPVGPVPGGVGCALSRVNRPRTSAKTCVA